MIGFDERPNPIWSGTITRNPSLRSASIGPPK
jgi:hypothetical protein